MLAPIQPSIHPSIRPSNLAQPEWVNDHQEACKHKRVQAHKDLHRYTPLYGTRDVNHTTPVFALLDCHYKFKMVADFTSVLTSGAYPYQLPAKVERRLGLAFGTLFLRPHVVFR